MASVTYPEAFFAYHRDGSLRSAREVIPLLWQFVQPKSIVDVGCGIGTWLSEFKNAGISDLLGIDGDYVDRKQLMIEPDRFQAHDLGKPLNVDRRFELAISLEVAEHLPAACADTFVESLTRLSNVILFSAAIPYQGGDNHINEQWPEYWQQRFARHGYVVVDCLRLLAWNNNNIMPWYRQNLLFYVAWQRLRDYPVLAGAFEKQGPNPPLSIVHPQYFFGYVKSLSDQLREAQRSTLNYALGLRQINVIVFPDWTRSPDQLGGEIRAMLLALSEHPDKQRMAVIVHAPDAHHEMAVGALTRISADVFSGREHLAADGPRVSVIGRQFALWEALMGALTGRIAMACENAQSVQSAGAQSLKVISISDLQNKQPLV